MDTLTQRIRLEVSTESDALIPWMEHFITDRRVSNLTPGTVNYYREKLQNFLGYCQFQGLEAISQLTPQFLRGYLEYLALSHNAGGVHSFYRSVRAFLIWYEAEVEIEGWKNPIRKIKSPKVPEQILEPIELDDLAKMLAACKKNWTGLRDIAILMILADTGLRANELLQLNREDVNEFEGSILVKLGKGRKPRMVYAGNRARKAVRAYLRKRTDNLPPLWVNQFGERLQYGGLRTILIRLAKRAKVKHYSPHCYRRFFALQSLRNGSDVMTLQLALGHSDLSVLRKYLKQTDQDIKEVHSRTSPIDRMKG